MRLQKAKLQIPWVMGEDWLRETGLICFICVKSEGIKWERQMRLVCVNRYRVWLEHLGQNTGGSLLTCHPARVQSWDPNNNTTARALKRCTENDRYRVQRTHTLRSCAAVRTPPRLMESHFLRVFSKSFECLSLRCYERESAVKREMVNEMTPWYFPLFLSDTSWRVQQLPSDATRLPRERRQLFGGL